MHNAYYAALIALGVQVFLFLSEVAVRLIRDSRKEFSPMALEKMIIGLTFICVAILSWQLIPLWILRGHFANPGVYGPIVIALVLLVLHIFLYKRILYKTKGN